VEPGVARFPMVIKIQLSLFPQSIFVDQRRLFDECLRRHFGERRQNGLENAGIALHGRIRQLLNLTERPQQDSQTLALPAEVDVRLTWRVCLLKVGYLMWRQGAPKTLGSQPGDDFIPRYAERRADYREQSKAPPCYLWRRPNLFLDSILRVFHIDSRFVASHRLHYSIAGTRGQLNDQRAVGRRCLKKGRDESIADRTAVASAGDSARPEGDNIHRSNRPHWRSEPPRM
jgi:hypothetical protein